jgi:hypothetical protein
VSLNHFTVPLVLISFSLTVVSADLGSET